MAANNESVHQARTRIAAVMLHVSLVSDMHRSLVSGRHSHKRGNVRERPLVVQIFGVLNIFPRLNPLRK